MKRMVSTMYKNALFGSNNVQEKPIVIIGAGISGLSVAYWLQQRGLQVIVLEKNNQPGGTISTHCEKGWVVESGPNSALETTPLFRELFADLGIADKVVYASDASKKRFVVRNNKLHEVPLNPITFATSRLWSWYGKLRLIKEPFVGREMKEESVAEFVTRRLGKEFLDYAIDPFIAGVYAGSPEKLSVQLALPKLYALEKKYGGLIKGMIRERKEREIRNEFSSYRARMFSFIDGMQTLPNAIAKRLGSSLLLNCTVEKLNLIVGKHPPSFNISYKQDNIMRSIETSTVIFASPAYVTAKIVQSIDSALASALGSIYYPPVAEVFMGFKRHHVKRSLNGFGFLVPSKECRTILGAIWSSAIFPNCTPEDYVALTSFVGGACQPELALQSEDGIAANVFGELRSLMKIEGNPVITKVTRWERSIPQYNLGYADILKSIDNFEWKYPGIFLSGNYRGGISIGDCLVSAEKLAGYIGENNPSRPIRR